MRTIKKQTKFFINLKFNDEVIFTFFKKKEGCTYSCCEKNFYPLRQVLSKDMTELKIVNYLSGKKGFKPSSQ